MFGLREQSQDASFRTQDSMNTCLAFLTSQRIDNISQELAWRREGPLWARGSAFGGRGGFYGYSSPMDPGFPRSGFPSAQCKRQRDQRRGALTLRRHGKVVLDLMMPSST